MIQMLQTRLLDLTVLDVIIIALVYVVVKLAIGAGQKMWKGQ